MQDDKEAPAGRQRGRGVQSVEVGGRLLNVLASADGPLMLREIAAGADLPSGQAHAYLVSFRTMGMVEQNPSTGKYHLGPFALKLGLARIRHHEPLQTIWDAVPAFAESINLMVTMAIWTEYGPVILRLYEAPFQIYSNIRTGARYSLTDTATGRLFAALMPAAITTPLIQAEWRRDRPTDGERPTLAEYRAALEDIRRDGCSWTEGKPVPNISAIAAPIYDLNEQMVAAVTVIGQRGVVDCSPDGLHRLRTVEFARAMSQTLGYLAR